jgi:predicted nucleotidyltransferase
MDMTEKALALLLSADYMENAAKEQGWDYKIYFAAPLYT